MAATILGMAGAGVEIDNAEAVRKSWPGFFEGLEAARINF